MKRERKQVLYEGGGILSGRLTEGTYEELRIKRPEGVWVLLVPTAALEQAKHLLRSVEAQGSSDSNDPRQLTWCE